MAYFKVDNIDLSAYVNGLTIGKTANYNAQTNAAGDTVVDYINTKRTITVNFIQLNGEQMKTVLSAIDKFSVNISYLNPLTAELTENIDCIVPENEVEYMTINKNGTIYNEFSIDFIEL